MTGSSRSEGIRRSRAVIPKAKAGSKTQGDVLLTQHCELACPRNSRINI